uniref:BRCT domain-containing protein n=1 Tax=Aureoumbra lagunensis TaxID=44058 RepID=A0A7S3JZP8_9STRA|mmetsp:Transcript_6319/g.8875  ORF Transcript_6319/g.8875 Transcript_6319/m.8875 type:complete len:188 (-) Transcript_6319:130-693(-)
MGQLFSTASGSSGLDKERAAPTQAYVDEEIIQEEKSELELLIANDEHGVSLDGKTVVVTGTFGEVGREEVKDLCKRFGARITGSVSGKTDILVVGNHPGPAKISQAQERGVQLLSINELVAVIRSCSQAEDESPERDSSHNDETTTKKSKKNNDDDDVERPPKKKAKPPATPETTTKQTRRRSPRRV